MLRIQRCARQGGPIGDQPVGSRELIGRSQGFCRIRHRSGGAKTGDGGDKPLTSMVGDSVAVGFDFMTVNLADLPWTVDSEFYTADDDHITADGQNP